MHFCQMLFKLFSTIHGDVQPASINFRGRKFKLTEWQLYIVRSYVTVICGHNAIYMLWGNTVYCMKLSDYLSRYSNEIESENVLTKNVMSR